MITTSPATEDWRSAWPDALAFAFGLTLAWYFKWATGDLVWTLWLSSLVVGYSMILWTIIRPALAIVSSTSRDRALVIQMSTVKGMVPIAAGALVLLVGGLFMLAFFTVHFGMFHFVHSQFLAAFFPVDVGNGVERGLAGMTTYAEVFRRYWWFLPSAFLAERAAFASDSPLSADGRPVTLATVVASTHRGGGTPGGAMVAPYKNVVRMHLLIFFFAFAHLARLDSFAVYAVVYAVYFFPWRLVRRRAVEATLVSPRSPYPARQRD